MFTGTTQPTRFDSVLDAWTGPFDDAKAVRRKLGRATGDDDGMPPHVTVVEPTERGVPHAHFAMSDVDSAELPTERDLHDFWNARGRGYQIEYHPIESNGDRWAWADGRPADAQGRPPASYLAQDVASITSTASLSASDVMDVPSAYRALGEREIDPDDPITTDVESAIDRGGVNPAAVRMATWRTRRRRHGRDS